MKLKDIAEIKEGLKIDPRLIRAEKKANGIYFQYLQAKDFEENKGFYIYQKEFRKINASQRALLSYGDYIIYKNSDSYKIHRYDDLSGNTVAGNGLFVISSNVGILNDYFSSEKNRKYFYSELVKAESHGELTPQKILDIEINTDHIFELEESNVAEHLGIRRPIKFSDVPFNIYQKPIPVDKLLKRIENSELLLDSEFQRRPGLWDIGTKSRLIESMIIRLPIPAFYFDGTDDNQWLVIDGLQRLSAVHEFIKGKFVLTELDYLPEIDNKAFSELDRSHQRNIEEFEVFAYIIQKGTPKAVTYKIFKNINTSALKLDPQEIRHALNPGKPAALLKSVAEKTWFRENLLVTDRQRDRMEDRETALRFLAFQIAKVAEYKPPLTDFLDHAMTDLYDIPEVRLQLYVQSLEEILTIVKEKLGPKAFSRSLFDQSNNRVYGHNNILFELITYGISIIHKDERHKLLEGDKLAIAIKDHFGKKQDVFWEYESAYTAENLKTRFSEIESLFKELIHDNQVKNRKL